SNETHPTTISASVCSPSGSSVAPGEVSRVAASAPIVPALAATHACSGALKDNSTTPSVVVMPVVFTRTVSSVGTTSNGEVSAEPETGGAVTEAASWVVDPDEVP